MKVSALIKELADWSPDTEVVIVDTDSERYSIELVGTIPDDFDNVMIIVHREDEQ